ncbi:MAG: glycosyltransferase family 4 protein [Victivallaceae bacterium]
MRILVSCIPYDQGKSGISVYINQVISELERQGHLLTLIVEPDAASYFSAFPLIVAPRLGGIAVLNMLWHLLILPFIIKRRDFNFMLIAAANRRAMCFYPLFTVAVVHDLAQYHVKAKYDVWRMLYLKHVLPYFVKRASQIAAISQCTADDLVKFWRVNPAKITVNYNGLSLHCAADGDNTRRFGIEPGKYILYVSRIEHPGKNHLNLIKAFEILPEELRLQYKLVLAGSCWDGADEVKDYAAKSAASRQIVFCGFVAHGGIQPLFQGAALYIFPSFYEGFGLSLIEAMAYGIPCACSRSSSLGEIAGQAALLFEPSDVKDISSAIVKLLTDEELREEMVRRGKQRAQEFEWKKHVEKLVKIYEAGTNI